MDNIYVWNLQSDTYWVGWEHIYIYIYEFMKPAYIIYFCF